MLNSEEIKKELETAIKIGDSPIGKSFGCIISKSTAKATLDLINQLEAELKVCNEALDNSMKLNADLEETITYLQDIESAYMRGEII